MAREWKHTGIKRRGNSWRVTVRVNGKQYGATYKLDRTIGDAPSPELLADMLSWQAEQVEKHQGVVTAAGSFAADIKTYLSRVAAMPTIDQRTAHLELWAAALGRDRARRTITPTEIDAVLQDWIAKGAANDTVRKRRTALQSMFVTLDGKFAKNPVKATKNPAASKPEARGMDYPTVERILATMPDRRSAKPGTDRGVSIAKLALSVIAYTGIPPGMLRNVSKSDLSLTAGTVRLLERKKGGGVAARTLTLTEDGIVAFRRFHDADAFGKFKVGPLNVAFKRAAKRAGVTGVHAYDLRHSVGAQLYRVTRDLATVGRMLGHAPGSVVTARYAMAADAEVDAAAVAAFNASLVKARQAAAQAPTAKRAKPKPVKVTATSAPRLVKANR